MSRFKNLNRQLVGERFGRLTVVGGPVYKPTHNDRFWECKCDCGADRVVREDSLVSGATVSCGCHSRDSHTKPIAPGTRFGRLVVKGVSSERKRQSCVCYECVCDCGKTTIVGSSALRSGKTSSCGCYNRDVTRQRSTKHKGTVNRPKGEPLYIAWCGMRHRCSAKEGSRDFDGYANRGIRVCDEWLHDYAAFRDWSLANGYAPGLSIDRIDNNSGYSPDNCRWTTPYVQNRNKRSNIWVTYNGKQLCLTDAAAEAGLPYKVVHSRIRHGWSTEEALSTPVGKYLGSARQHRRD